MDRDITSVSKPVRQHLYKKYGLSLVRISPSVEADVAIFYKNDHNGYSLVIEVYNDGDISGIVNDDINKRIIFADDVKDFNFSKLVNKFKENEQ